MGGDRILRLNDKSLNDFNPLRPCGRRLNGYFYFNTDDLFQSTPPVWAETRLLFGSLIQAMKFQSTPPVWAETKSQRTQRTALIYFNPLRPCGRRLHSSPRRKDSGCNFNPLRPCGRRLQIAFSFPAGTGFQSTPPVWAETVRQVYTEVFKSISIHSARVGGDSTVRSL